MHIFSEIYIKIPLPSFQTAYTEEYVKGTNDGNDGNDQGTHCPCHY